MAEIDHTRNQKEKQARDHAQDRRCRGRPQLRPDAETRQIIYEASRHEFARNGYAATSMEAVARLAGVSTKTLYRLIPNKASLFEGMVSDRLDRFLSVVNLHAADHTDIEQALFAALMACADLALDDVDEAAGMLLGMVSSAPRRAAMFGGVPLPSRPRIEARVRNCVTLFLRGCQVQGVRSR